MARRAGPKSRRKPEIVVEVVVPTDILSSLRVGTVVPFCVEGKGYDKQRSGGSGLHRRAEVASLGTGELRPERPAPGHLAPDCARGDGEEGCGVWRPGQPRVRLERELANP